MVEIEPLTVEDRTFLARIIERHVAETGSSVGRRILDDSDLDNFAKVMPVDYRRVLEATATAEAEGRDVDEAIMAAARV